MGSARVTVSLPDDVRRAAQRIAEERGTSFSAVVAEALTGWMRGRLVDAWLAEHQAAHGEFHEDELRALAVDAGVPYVGPGRVGGSAA
jgi:predicted transcriptional regulator